MPHFVGSGHVYPSPVVARPGAIGSHIAGAFGTFAWSPRDFAGQDLLFGERQERHVLPGTTYAV